MYQTTVSTFKQEMVPSMSGRALRSFDQHSSMVLHSSLLNLRRVAPSGSFGRPPLGDRIDYKDLRLDFNDGTWNPSLRRLVI